MLTDCTVADHRGPPQDDCAKSIVGTPYYLSPELCLGNAYDHHADIWAAGVVLFELCTLQRPFSSDAVPSLLLSIMNNRVRWCLLAPAYGADQRRGVCL